MSRSGVACWVFMVVVGGCGGQAERTVGDGEEDPGGSADERPPAGSSPGYSELPVCVKGFDRFENSNKKCNWLAEMLCYDTKEAACACICPVNEDSLCVSSFYGGEGTATPVFCD